jgi:hypothetical protein
VWSAALLLPGAAAAQTASVDVSILGGRAAMARALGVDAVPDRPRFLAELIRVIYDGREGQSADVDAKLARVASHLDVAGRFQSALAAVQPGKAGLALAMATATGDRQRLKEFLELVGLKLTGQNRSLRVEQGDDKQAAERVTLLNDLGIDLTTLAARLNAGQAVRIDVTTETVPAPLAAKVWGDAVFQRPVSPSTLFAAIMSDRRAALLAHGLAALNDDTLAYLAGHAAILTRLYEQNAAAFAAFGGALRIRDGRVVPPGGADGVRAWESVLNEKVTRPDRFIRELFGAEQGRLAVVYDTLAHLDPPHVRFALGSWMPDPAARVGQFRTLVAAAAARREWDVDRRPFIRPVHDPTLLLVRVRVTPDGAPVRPAARVFWEQAFESADLPDDPVRRPGTLQDGGLVDAGWLAEHICVNDVRARRERLDQLAFGQRAFATSADGQWPDALVAVRALIRFRTLMLELDRMGVRTPGVYAAAARHAQRLTSLDGRQGFVALAQFQGAAAVVGRLVRVRSLTAAAGESLIAGLAAVSLNDGSEYAGAIARWIEGNLGPALAWTPGADIEVQLVRSLSGRADPEASAAKVTWENRVYRVDLVAPERQRLTRAREKMGAPPVRRALDLEHLATRLSAASVSLSDVREAVSELHTLAAVPAPKEERGSAVRPPGVDAPGDPAEIANTVARDLSKISRTEDLKKVARAVEPLFGLSDDLLAHALTSLAYALDIGDPDGPTLMGGDVGRRHDFGLAIGDRESRIRIAWATPSHVASPKAPWHVVGSLLGLDAALSSLALRRVDMTEMPQMPVLTAPDREAFTKTLVWMNPFDLTEAGRDAIVAAIERGRSRVRAIPKDATGWDEIADHLRIDGWRRRAVRWAIVNDAALVLSFFSLTELSSLGAPPADLPLDRWGMASEAGDACLCLAAPVPGREAVLVGRPQLGLLASAVADVNLHVAEALSRLRLPAALARGVLAAALQDYLDQVRPLHHNDWLTLVRAAQAIPDERIADYVAALTADGSLTPERSSAGDDSRRR